jgi:TusE/DsrC/DsvC family sulfur relay protein
MEKVIAGKAVDVNPEGYLTHPEEWTEDIAAVIAAEEEVGPLSPDHWKVLRYLRDQQTKGIALSIRGIGKSGVVDIKTFYELFPNGPLKKSSKIAGIPKPASCI